MIYDLIAPFYDAVNRDIDYGSWADFIEECFQRYMSQKPTLVLDLASGTGSMTLELAKRGYDMTGVDISTEMLEISREKAEKAGQNNILWLCQDMRAFELYGTVDAAVCCLDSINHLTRTAELLECLALVHNYLIPDGLFIFDINARAKFETVYADNAYVMNISDDVCIWQNFYNEKTRLCDFLITLFKAEDDGRYERYEECDRERMYTLRSVKSALSKSGFEFVGAYSDFDFTEASDGCDRIYFVAKCKKQEG